MIFQQKTWYRRLEIGDKSTRTVGIFSEEGILTLFIGLWSVSDQNILLVYIWHETPRTFRGATFCITLVTVKDLLASSCRVSCNSQSYVASPLLRSQLSFCPKCSRMTSRFGTYEIWQSKCHRLMAAEENNYSHPSRGSPSLFLPERPPQLFLK